MRGYVLNGQVKVQASANVFLRQEHGLIYSDI
jgi:hypothetical protein